jgi:hypothetical protein
VECEFEIVEGEWRGERLGVPRDDVVVFGVACAASNRTLTRA